MLFFAGPFASTGYKVRRNEAYKMVKTVGKYQIGKTLGEGTFGKVKYAMNTETGESVAIKVLDKEKIQKQSMGAQVGRQTIVHSFSIIPPDETPLMTISPAHFRLLVHSSTMYLGRSNERFLS